LTETNDGQADNVRNDMLLAEKVVMTEQGSLLNHTNINCVSVDTILSCVATLPAAQPTSTSQPLEGAEKAKLIVFGHHLATLVGAPAAAAAAAARD
jgi:hypothetical protein